MRRPGTWVAKMWWEQEGLDIVELRTVATASDKGGGEGDGGRRGGSSGELNQGNK